MAGVSLEEIGEILHVVQGDRAIAKVKITPKLGLTVFDIRRKPIGRIVDIFGPIKSPYIEIEVEEQNPEKLVNSPIYISPKDRGMKGKR
ncbi:MAG: Gar1/Naf1 family protein [Candidatus Bathyarchaeia archaeon]